MKIAICASMVFTERMLEIKKELEKMGHECFVSGFADSYVGKTENEIEKLKLFHKNAKDAIREFWEKIRKVTQSLF
ncbi:hypothetical protein HYY73_05210 [Candidatus Woesearchaeota archaeon]|nr:hypothetical protein [Candidatus Woesearchaeota archaeon]